MKVSKLFHWLYAIVIFVPFMVLIFNFVSSITRGVSFDLNSLVASFDFVFDASTLSSVVFGVFNYLVIDMFGIGGSYAILITDFLTYWCCVSLIWLVFDIVMYLPLLVHSWLDRGVIQ